MRRFQLLPLAAALAAFAWPPLLAAEPVLPEGELATLGHRNFIVVADMAYPWQSADGIGTRYLGGDHLKLLERLLAEIEAAPHVNPVVYVDAELSAIEESAAPGITDYREALDKLLGGRPVRRLPHMEIIKKLDASAELFEVRILKTDLTLPYTSVFIELDCGYWDGEREAALREKLAARP
jgi:hypothetical protein